MTSIAAIKAVLEADATLLALATGGIYDFNETGRTGINRTNVPAAFNQTTEVIKPCILIKLRSAAPDGALQDEATQYVSVREMIELWFYEDSGFANIDAMQARCFVLLHDKRLSGTFKVQWIGDATQFRDDILDAQVNRSDYVAIVKRSA